MTAVVKNSNLLAGFLKSREFDVIERNGVFSNTHQIFIHIPSEYTHKFFLDCQLYNITLNERYSSIYNGSGIRLGVQQISRYGWNDVELSCISEIIELIYDDCLNSQHIHHSRIRNMINNLVNQKIMEYTLIKRDTFMMYKKKERFVKFSGDEMLRINGSVQVLKIENTIYVLDINN